MLQEVSSEEGWIVQTMDHAEFEEVTPDLKLLISLPPDPGLQDLALQNPDIHFLAIGIPGLQTQANLSILSPEGLPIDQQAFIAGYTSAILTKDWRIGLILDAESERANVVKEAFSNGIVYYCGLCQLAYPPFHYYPIIYEFSSEPSKEDWLLASESLLSYAVETAYIYSENLNLAAMEHLVENGVTLIGIQDPPIELNENWATTIRFNFEEVIHKHWDTIINNLNGVVDIVPIRFINTNADLFSTGRQLWAEETLQDLLQGNILPMDPTP
jgi:hypothetical protein